MMKIHRLSIFRFVFISPLARTAAWTMALLWMGSAQAVYAQEAQALQLVDQSGAPLAYAAYRYGTQQGSAGEEGYIQLKAQTDTFLEIQHLLLGRRTFSPEQVREALQVGRLEMAVELQSLRPVTVMEMRPRQGEASDLSVDTDARLTHDAGSFLQRDLAVQGVRKSGSYGFDPVIRGFKYDRLNVVIDGAQCASAACPNRMDPPVSQVSLNQMERVEILKGPHALRYGPVVGATINFVSPRPQFGDSLRPMGRASAGYEANGQIQRYEAMGGFRNQHWEVKLNGAFSEGRDYEDGEGQTVPAAFQRSTYGGSVAYRLAPSHTVSVQATHNRARDVDFPALPMDLREDNTTLVNARHRYESRSGGILSRWETTVYGTWVDHQMNNLERPTEGRMADAETEAQTRNYGGRTELRLAGEDHWTYTGLDYRRERADGIRSRRMRMGPMAGMTHRDNVWQDGQLDRSGLFAEHHRRVGRYQLIASGRLDWVEGRAHRIAEGPAQEYNDMGRTDFNPSLSLGAQRKLGRGYSLGFWTARSVRSAGLAERYINFFPIGSDPYELIGNPDLEPEVNYQADLRLSRVRLQSRVEVSGFVSYLEGFISSRIREDLAPVMGMAPGVRQFVNIEEALMTGGEVRWRQQWSDGFHSRLGAVYTYGEDLTRNEPLPEVPPLELRAQFGGRLLENGKLHPMLHLRHALRQGRNAAFFGETETPAFTVVDAVVQYALNSRISLTAGVENLLDAHYYEHLNRATVAAQRPLFAPGRNAYLTLSARLP